ncbi:MAG: kinase [Deltaproteobacteria bacterium]|nr:kinase [Deltaproteobacteria bacterium]
MIISRTPFRISFFGGGTDYPAWYRERGGVVLATTIDKYCYITCRYLPPFFEHRYRVVYSKIETVKHYSEIEHPAVKAVLEWANARKGLEIHHDGDLPARSGLGSSSSFTVGLLNALSALNGKHISKEELANQALHVEQEIIKEHVGSQDQICAAFGGFNRVEFRQNGSFDISPLILPMRRKEELESNLMLFFTGFSRIASNIAKSKIDNMKHREAELTRMQELVDEAVAVLRSETAPIEEFGKLLHLSWMEKRKLSPLVTTPKIDEIYEEGLKAGATGGKILGAGGGGFLLLFVRPELREQVREALKYFIHVPFKFEDFGSKIALYQPNGL